MEDKRLDGGLLPPCPSLRNGDSVNEWTLWSVKTADWGWLWFSEKVTLGCAGGTVLLVSYGVKEGVLVVCGDRGLCETFDLWAEWVCEW